MNIGIPKESLAGETRVACTPTTVAQLQKLGFAVPERMIAIFGLERDIDGIQRDKARSHIDGALQGVGKDTYGRGNEVRRNFSDKD